MKNTSRSRPVRMGERAAGSGLLEDQVTLTTLNRTWWLGVVLTKQDISYWEDLTQHCSRGFFKYWNAIY